MRCPRLAACLLAVASCGREGAPPPSRPNFVLILADDLGWKDVSYAGSAYPTPNVDALAAGGIVFERGYATSPGCSPTRASLLTGRYPGRFGLTRAIRNKDYLRARELERRRESGLPIDEAEASREITTFVPEDQPTFAERLSEEGYETVFIGKWHLGLAPHLPDRYGFRRTSSVGSVSGMSYFGPFALLRGVTHEPRADEYLTDHLTEEAVAFLREPHERPFFLYLSHYAVHGPWEAKPELVEAVAPELDPASEQGSAVYGAMIRSLDESVGRIVDTLDELGLRESTVVVFTSDNGPTLEKNEHMTTTAPLRGKKLELYEGGLRVPWVVSWPGSIRPGATSRVPVVSLDLVPTFLSIAGAAPLAPPQDGLDLSPLLLERGDLERRPLFFYAGERAAILRGDEKLMRFQDGRTELYDLAADPGESRDRSPEDPSRARELAAELERWLASVGIEMPAPTSDGAPEESGEPDDG